MSTTPARDAVFRLLTGGAVCPPPRDQQEASERLDAHAAEVLRKAADDVDCALWDNVDTTATTVESAWLSGVNAVLQLLSRMADEAGKDTATGGESTRAGELSDAQPPMVCVVCEKPVRWIDSPATGGWWNHASRPGDGHGIRPRPAYNDRAPADVIVYRARHDAIVMGLYTTAAARAHCETAMHREIPGVRLDWIVDDEDADSVAELVAAIGEDERSTGYVVESLTVASAYDEEADE